MKPSRRSKPRHLFLGLLGSFFALVAWTATAGGEDIDLFDELRFRHIGPLGNRVTSVVGVAGEPRLYFAGAASGGIWRSRDGGHGWQPVFDEAGVASIGSLAIAPSDPNVIWAGTGEAFIRSNVSIGNGIYLSEDGGETWRHRGLEKTGRLARLIVDPRDPETVWVAALGHGYGPQEERGIFKTDDGGETWRRVLFVDAMTGASDIVMDPNNPRILFAGFWQFQMDGAGRTSGGPGSSLWRSADGGETWTQLRGAGLPAAPWGKIGLATTAADSGRIYALIETSSNKDFAPVDAYPGTLWRSEDGGGTWSMVNASNELHQRPLYYSRVVAAPDDADELHFMATRHHRSTDGGIDVESVGSGWDHHDMWIDPADPDRMIVGHDGGVAISVDRGKSWYRPQLPIAQMYSVTVDDQIPYRVYGNRQDGDAMRGPSRTLDGGEIPLGAWEEVGGCEIGRSIPDSQDPEIVYSTCYDGILERWHGRSGLVRDISVWPEAIESWPAEGLRYRFTWGYPIAISPHTEGRLYAGSHLVHQSDDRGETWREISPDLTSADPALMGRRGGLTLDDAGPTVAPSLSVLKESKHRIGELWAGSNDGRLHRRPDMSSPWQDLTDRLPGLPALGTVSDIEISPHDPATIYVSVDRHRENDRRSWVFRSRDSGGTWRAIIEGLEQDVFASVHALKADPVRPGLLFLGTANGLYFSLDDGERWRSVGGGLPPAPIFDLEIQERFGDLVVATYGRGFWVLDDLSALRQLGAPDEPALFSPRPTYRFRGRTSRMAQPDVPAVGVNPESGALLHYFLPEAVSSATLEVLDADGRIVRELEPSMEPGLHRVAWNLYGEATTTPKLRTRPKERPDQILPAEGWRRLSDGGPVRLLARPGTYTLRLTLESEVREGDAVEDGEEAKAASAAKSLESSLELLIDPGSSELTDAENLAKGIDEQYLALEELRGMAESAASLINEIEWLRSELRSRSLRFEALEEDGRGLPEDSGDRIHDAIEGLERALEELEGRFFDLRLSGASQDTLRWKRLLWARIGYLAWRIGSSDGPPTASQLEVLGLLRKRLAEAEERFDELAAGEITELRDLLEAGGWATLALGRRAPEAGQE